MNNYCKTCGSEIKYSNKFDSFYCELCNKWLEKTCNDPSCEFCSSRPSKPSESED